jgi:hypothetical protein
MLQRVVGIGRVSLFQALKFLGLGTTERRIEIDKAYTFRRWETLGSFLAEFL